MSPLVAFNRSKKGQRKTQDPCENCFLHKDRCICEFIPTLNLKTKLVLVVHAKEVKRTTNTGLLATKALPNSQIYVRGNIDSPLDLSPLLSSEVRSVLFFPCDEAVELNQEFVQQSPLPIQLIVPDGNWRQASKVHYRHSELKSLPRVMIKNKNLSTHHLRAESTNEGMATLQAIAYAFGVIEGEEVQQSLLNLYQQKLKATFLGRGIEI